MSGARGSISLSELLAEVDRLEKELKELGREAQRGGDFVHQLQELVERDTKRVGEIERDTSKIAREMLEWEERERFLADAVSTGTQSSRLLVQMESLARSKLEEERRITSQLREELVAKVMTFTKKVEMEEEEYRKIPEYAKMLKIEEIIRKKTAMMDHLEREVVQMVGEKQMWEKEVKEDREAWSGFKTVCVNLAEQWLKMKKMGEEVDMLKKEREGLEEQVNRLVAERSVNKDVTPTKSVPHHHHIPETDRSHSTLPAGQPVTLPSTCHPSPDRSGTTDITSTISNVSFLPPSLSSVTFKPPTQSPPTQPSPPYVPPTPRTKLLHLKLGTSLLTSKKISGVTSSSTLLPPSQHGRMTSPMAPTIPPLNLPPSPQPKLPTPHKQSEKLQPVKMKSFKLGLPSLYTRKKSQSPAAHHSSVKEEVLVRNPTMPGKVKEVVMDMDTEEGDLEKDVDVDYMEEGEDKFQDVGKAATNNCPPSSLQLPLQTAKHPTLQLMSSQAATASTVSPSMTAAAQDSQLPCTLPMDRKQLQSVSPGTAMSDQKRNKLLDQQLESPLPVPTHHKLSSTQLPVSSSYKDNLAAVPSLQQSPTPSPLSRRQVLCVSPGTVLSDQKRKAVLQQLLESPQPVQHVRQAVETQTVLDVDREKVERIVSPPPGGEGRQDGRFVGFDFGGETSSGFSFEGSNEGTNNDFNFGGEESKGGFGFGDVGAENSEDFNFFGGEEEDKGEESQGGGDDFSFSFGGVFEGEKSGAGGGGFSLF